MRKAKKPREYEIMREARVRWQTIHVSAGHGRKKRTKMIPHHRTVEVRVPIST